MLPLPLIDYTTSTIKIICKLNLFRGTVFVVLPINAARDLDSDCSLPFLSVFYSDPGYMSRRIQMLRTDKFDT